MRIISAISALKTDRQARAAAHSVDGAFAWARTPGALGIDAAAHSVDEAFAWARTPKTGNRAGAAAPQTKTN